MIGLFGAVFLLSAVALGVVCIYFASAPVTHHPEYDRILREGVKLIVVLTAAGLSLMLWDYGT